MFYCFGAFHIVLYFFAEFWVRELFSLIGLKRIVRIVRIVRINISVVYTELWVKGLLSVIGLKSIVRRKRVLAFQFGKWTSLRDQLHAPHYWLFQDFFTGLKMSSSTETLYQHFQSISKQLRKSNCKINKTVWLWIIYLGWLLGRTNWYADSEYKLRDIIRI